MSQDLYRSAYRHMLTARLLDEKYSSLYRGGKIHGGVYLGKGHETISVASGLFLKPHDIFSPLIRDAAGRLAFGEPILDAVRTYLGSALGPMKGREGNVHRGNLAKGLLPMISHLGAMISVVNGILLSYRFQKKNSDAVGVAIIGEGATSTGAFHEGLNQAAIEKLPLLVVVADNQYAYSTPKSRQFACKDLVLRAQGYGIQGYSFDATQFAPTLDLFQELIQKLRNGQGPILAIGQLLRLCGHGEHDDYCYLDDSLKDLETSRDCLEVAQNYLLDKGIFTELELGRFRQNIHQYIEETIAQVQQEPSPDPYLEKWETYTTPRPLME